VTHPVTRPDSSRALPPRALPGSNMIVWRARPPLDGTAAAAAAAAAVPPSEWPSVGAAPWVPRSLHGDTNTDEMFIYTTILYLTQACACTCTHARMHMHACTCTCTHAHATSVHLLPTPSCQAACLHPPLLRGMHTRRVQVRPSPPLPHTARRRRRRWRDGHRRRGRPGRPSRRGAARAAGSRPAACLLVRIDG